jgi:nicotinate-nucleotide adenylyltransferase
MMERERLRELISRIQASREPVIEFLSRVDGVGNRVGVFASSFNPITSAHLELMKRAAREFELPEQVALAGVANADKTSYQSSLEDRLEMLLSALDEDHRASIALSSHAYFVDVVEALERLYPAGTQFFFIVGFDTFERVLDRNDLYTRRYHRTFANRKDALRFLLERAHLVVAGRAGSTQRDVGDLLEDEPLDIAASILYLDLPSDVADRSATEVRERIKSGDSITGLVAPAVERYIAQHGLYKNRELW